MKDYQLDNMLCILPDEIGRVMSLREQTPLDGIDVDAAMKRAATKFSDVKGTVAIVPIHGYISHRATIWSALGMESASETIGQWVDSLMDNPAVGSIIFDVDSPGGTAAGLTGISNKIRGYRGKKPMVAVVNDMMASAAYFIGSAADEITADPDSLTGSIGTIMVHMDYSEMLEKAGVKTTIIHAGKYKAEANPYQPLSDEAKEHLQDVANQYYESFIAAVSENRTIKKAQIISDFGNGRVMRAEDALSVGMIDRVGTLESVIERIRPKNTAATNRIRNQAYSLYAESIKAHH